MATSINSRAARKGLIDLAMRPDQDPPLRKILMQCKQTFVLMVGLTVLIEALSLTPLLYMLSVFDRVISARSGITLVSLTLVVVGFYVFWGAMEWIRSRLMVRLSLRIDWDLAADVFDASFRRYVGRRNVNVHQLLEDLLNMRQFMTGAPILAIISAPFALVFIGVGGIFHHYLALFALAASVLMLLFTYLSLKITGPILLEAQKANTEASRLANSSLRHAEATLAMGMLGAVRNRWYDQHRQFLTKQVYASEASGLMGGFTGFLTKALPSLQMALAAFLAIEGLITGGMVMIATMLIGKSIGPMNQLISNWKPIINAKESYERLNELLIEDEKDSHHMQLPAPNGKLDVTSLVGVPPGHDKPVLAGIDFNLEPGQILAVVGPSAAGKSSLVKLLLGVWRPANGSVRLDGVELADWSHDEVGPLVGYVPQEIDFLEGTVAENIARLGEVDPEKVVQAATLIGMHEIILGFPQGYDTQLGDTGFALSGGQRQRLAIARAVYGLPKYVVMDEPNSNLDEVGEAALVKTIEALKASGSTVVITTHRPRLVSVVDLMLVLKSGKQVAFGPAKDILDAVRKLQVVTPPNATPAAASNASTQTSSSSLPITEVAALPSEAKV
jgi:ATP-binding cassette subfamily C exporter for protease/lipase/ATP-binding cassette subfamily C protein EexD